MAQPTPMWIILPVTNGAYAAVTITKYATEDAAKAAAARAAISSGTQYIVLGSEFYADPEVTNNIITESVKPFNFG